MDSLSILGKKFSRKSEQPVEAKNPVEASSDIDRIRAAIAELRRLGLEPTGFSVTHETVARLMALPGPIRMFLTKARGEEWPKLKSNFYIEDIPVHPV